MSNRSIFRIIIGIAIVVSISALLYFSSESQTLLYRDAKSHLNIARRVFFSQTPGLVQLGGIWLPLPHLLMLPTIWFDPFYYSGLAGIIPSMISFVIVAVVTYKLILYLTEDVGAGIIGMLVILSSPSLLYLQSTPMSEMPLLATSIASIYFFIRWIKERQYWHIMFAALCVMLATLTRYDGWFLFGCEFIVISLIVVSSMKTSRKAEGHLFLYTFLGGFGIALWLLYNKAIFGSYTNFALGKGSAAWDTQRVTTAVTETSKHNFFHSFATFNWMGIDNAGIILIIGAIIGLGVFLSTQRPKILLLSVLLLLSPYIFNIISLFFGLSIAKSAHIFPFESYNLRYGATIIPAVAFFIGILASRGWASKITALILVIGQAFLLYSQPLEIIADAKVGNVETEHKVAEWVRAHPSKGNTILSTLAHDPLLFEGQIPMQKLVYEGNQHLWESALSFPEGTADRIILKQSDTVNDAVRRKLYNSKVLQEKYIKVYDNDYQVYDKKDLTQ